MKINFILIALLCLLPGIILSQNKASRLETVSFKVFVFDSQSSEPIPNAIVKIKNTATVRCEGNGRATMIVNKNLFKGNIIFSISAKGYKTHETIPIAIDLKKIVQEGRVFSLSPNINYQKINVLKTNGEKIIKDIKDLTQKLSAEERRNKILDNEYKRVLGLAERIKTKNDSISNIIDSLDLENFKLSQAIKEIGTNNDNLQRSLNTLNQIIDTHRTELEKAKITAGEQSVRLNRAFMKVINTTCIDVKDNLITIKFDLVDSLNNFIKDNTTREDLLVVIEKYIKSDIGREKVNAPLRKVLALSGEDYIQLKAIPLPSRSNIFTFYSFDSRENKLNARNSTYQVYFLNRYGKQINYSDPIGLDKTANKPFIINDPTNTCRPLELIKAIDSKGENSPVEVPSNNILKVNSPDVILTLRDYSGKQGIADTDTASVHIEFNQTKITLFERQSISEKGVTNSFSLIKGIPYYISLIADSHGLNNCSAELIIQEKGHSERKKSIKIYTKQHSKEILKLIYE